MVLDNFKTWQGWPFKNQTPDSLGIKMNPVFGCLVFRCPLYLVTKSKISAQPVAAMDLNFCYNLLFIFYSTQFRTFLVQLFELFVELISSAQLSPPEQAKWLPNVSLGADQPVAWLYLIDFLCSKSKGFLGQEQRRTILIINKNYYVRKNRKN